MNKKTLLIIQMGEPPAGIAAQVGQQGEWFTRAIAEAAENVQIVRPDRGDVLPAFSKLSAVIISGSWSMVTDRLDWSELTACWLREAYQADVPMLGVCYGHQLLADALGGKVGDNPNGKELGMLKVTIHPAASTDSWLAKYPREFDAYLTHQQSVLVPPEGAQVLASSQADGCQIIRYSDNVLTVQFHPEFDASIMLACLKYNEAALRRNGWDVDRLMQLPEEPVWARQLLLDFVRRYVER